MGVESPCTEAWLSGRWRSGCYCELQHKARGSACSSRQQKTRHSRKDRPTDPPPRAYPNSPISRAVININHTPEPFELPNFPSRTIRRVQLGRVLEWERGESCLDSGGARAKG